MVIVTIGPEQGRGETGGASGQSQGRTEPERARVRHNNKNQGRDKQSVTERVNGREGLEKGKCLTSRTEQGRGRANRTGKGIAGKYMVRTIDGVKARVRTCLGLGQGPGQL